MTSLDDIQGSADFYKLNPNLRKSLTREQRAKLPMDLSQPTKADVKNEKGLQGYCTGLLRQRNYVCLTAENADAVAAGEIPCAGWYGHLYEARRNAFMPDLIILDPTASKRPLLVELKHGKPRWQPGQESMCLLGVWVLCTSFEEFVVSLNTWEKEEVGR